MSHENIVLGAQAVNWRGCGRAAETSGTCRPSCGDRGAAELLTGRLDALLRCHGSSASQVTACREDSRFANDLRPICRG